MINKIALLALVLPLTLTACNDATSTGAASPAAAPAATASAAATAAPAADKAVVVPEDKDSQLACDSARRDIQPSAEALTGLGSGTATIADALDPIKKTANALSIDASFAHGAVQAAIQALSDDLARLRVALSNNGSDGAVSALGPVNLHLNATDSACQAIGH